MVVSSYGNLSLPNSCLTSSNLQSTNFRCTFTWSSTANIGLSQSSGNLSLQKTQVYKYQVVSIQWQPLTLKKLKRIITGLSQFSGNLSLHSLLWSLFLLRPSTNKLQTFIYRVVYPGGPSLIGKNDFYHFLFSIVCRHLFLNGY